MDKLEALRAKLKKNETNNNTDNALYPFWNTPPEKSCTLRFLPDKNEENVFFWVQKVTFRWTFPDNENPGKTLTVTMPSIETYKGEKTCPVTKELMPFFKGTADEKEICRKHWPKRTFITQGFVRKPGFPEENSPENPIRIFTLNKDVFSIVYAGLMDTDPDEKMENYPVEYENGRDFVVKVEKKGEWPDYSTSKWARNESDLTEDELAAIEQYGLNDLRDRLVERPSDEAFALQLEMLEASISGEPWNPEWEEHWKPWRPNSSNSSSTDDAPAATSSKPKRTKVVDEADDMDDDVQEDEVVDNVDDGDDEPAPKKKSGRSPEDILAEIRKRKKAS